LQLHCFYDAIALILAFKSIVFTLQKQCYLWSDTPKCIISYNLVDEEGFIKSREELEKYVNEKGLDKDKLQITYCTTGVRASYVAVILEELGFNVRNYEPSFARYANVGEVE